MKAFRVHGPFAGPMHVYPTEKRANSAARKLDAHLPKPGTSEHDFHVKMNGPGGAAKHTVKPVAVSKAGETYLPRPKTKWATPRENMSRMNYGVRAKKDTIARRRASIKPLGTTTVSAKGLQLLSLDAYYDLVKDQAGRDAYHADAAKRRAPDPARTAHVDRPPPTTSDVSSRLQNERRVAKFPRKMKPTIRMKPVSDDEAMAHLRSGTYNSAKQKSLRWLAALKALATGYSKVSGGGALKAANRGGALMLLGPSGRKAGKSGGHYRKRPRSGHANFGPDGRPGPKSDKAHFKKLHRAVSPVRQSLSLEKPSLAKKTRPSTSSEKSPRVLDAGGAAELSNSLDNVVIKSEGASMANTNFNDLFKAELGPSGGEVLCACPHCEAPITKSDLEKAHKGKGKATDVSGKRGKSSAHVSEQFPEGGAMRGGDGRGVLTPSRGVSGASKTDAVVGVQNGKGSNARKGGNAESSVEEGEDDVDKSEPKDAAPPPAVVKKSITIRGTDYVQYVDDGSDAALAKAIAEGGFGGTQPTQPLDLNNDLSRLLV